MFETFILFIWPLQVETHATCETRSSATAEGPRAVFHEAWEWERCQTAKVTFKVIQRHWQWCHLIGHIWFPVRARLWSRDCFKILPFVVCSASRGFVSDSWATCYKFQILTANMVQRADVRHHAKFCADWSDSCRDMAVFWIVKMAAVRHLKFLKVGNFLLAVRFGVSTCVIFEIWCWLVKPLLRYVHFSIMKIAASAILDF